VISWFLKICSFQTGRLVCRYNSVYMEAVVERTPAGRVGEPHEVGGTVQLLESS
jgi:hypothetical protein